MSRYHDNDEDPEEVTYRWEQEHDYRLHWKCYMCGYSYEAERYCNEGLLCPECKQTNCVLVGESYAG